jgi:hypothetical protein
MAGDLGNKKASFQKGLELLLKRIQQHQSNAEAALKLMTDLEKDLGDDLANIGLDKDKINAIYEGDKGVLKDIQNSIDAENEAMNKDMAMIAGGSTAIVVGALVLAVGVLAEIETAGASTALVVAGLGVLGAGATVVGIGAKDYDEKMKAKRNDTVKLATLNSEITVAVHLVGQSSALLANVKSARNALDSMVRTWQVLGTQFSAVLSNLDNMSPDDGPFLQSELASSKDDWNDVASTAELIQKQLIGLKVEINPDGPPQAQQDNNSALVATTRSLSARRSGLENMRFFSAALNNQGAGGIAKAVSQHISEIDLATSNLSMLSANAPSGVESQTSAGLSSQASKLEASVNELNSELSAIGHEYRVRLQSLASGNALDIKEAKQTFASLSASLIGLSATNLAVITLALDLAIGASTAIASFQAELNSISEQTAGLTSEEADLNQQIQTLKRKINHDRSIENIVCAFIPGSYWVTHELGDLITDEKRMEGRINSDHIQMEQDGQKTSALGQARDWATQMRLTADALSTHSNA